MKQMTALELIDETVKYYSKDTSRRGSTVLENGDEPCVYFKEYEDGKCVTCAVGRLLTDKSARSLGTEVFSYRNAMDDNRFRLKKKYAHFKHMMLNDRSRYFLSELQNFHDDPHNWDENGLTENGVHDLIHLKSLAPTGDNNNVERI